MYKDGHHMQALYLHLTVTLLLILKYCEFILFDFLLGNNSWLNGYKKYLERGS